MFPQRQIRYFLYQSHQNHDLLSIFRYSRALYRDYTSLHPQRVLPAPSIFPGWRFSLHPTHPSGQTFPGYSISLPSCPGVQLKLLPPRGAPNQMNTSLSLWGLLSNTKYVLNGESKSLPVQPESKSHGKNNLFLLAATLTSASSLKGCTGDLPHLSNHIFPQKLLVSATHLSQGLLFLKAPHGTEPLPHNCAAHVPLLLLFISVQAPLRKKKSLGWLSVTFQN